LAWEEISKNEEGTIKPQVVDGVKEFIEVSGVD
jgi:hypothetical protein